MDDYADFTEERHFPAHDPCPGDGETIAAGGLVVLSRYLDVETFAERLLRVEALRVKFASGRRLFEPGKIPIVQEDRSGGMRKKQGGRRGQRRKSVMLAPVHRPKRKR